MKDEKQIVKEMKDTFGIKIIDINTIVFLAYQMGHKDGFEEACEVFEDDVHRNMSEEKE